MKTAVSRRMFNQPRSLPKAPDYGTVHLVDAVGAVASTITLRAPLGRQFWLLGVGDDSSGGDYIPGASQDATRSGTMLVIHHQGTNWQTVSLSLLRAYRNVTWGTTINLNTGGNTASQAAYGLLFMPTPGFRGQNVRAYRTGSSAAVASLTLTPPSNPMSWPGGLVVAAAYQDAGGAGPTSITGEGWVGFFTGLLGVAYYILPTGSRVTAPPVTFVSSRSDTWAGCLTYLR